jgi:hypothetical protein
VAQEPHVPTPASISLVETAAGLGLPQDMICLLVGVSKKTLYVHYRDDPVIGNVLDKGKAKAVFEVAKTLFQRATTGKDLGAAIFYLKAQAGWREKHVLDDPETRKGLAELIALSGLSSTPPPPDAYVEPDKPATRQ